MDPIIIGVDTGNKQIKTATQVFVSGVQVSDVKKGIFQDNDTVFFNGKYYTPIIKRNGYKKDKTVDDDYFVLTLIGIMRELRERGIDPVKTDEPVKVILAVGLPPAHLVWNKEAFGKYFRRGLVSFEYNDEPVTLNIVNAHVLIQGYSAIFNHYAEIRLFRSAYIVDIGGYTTDVIGVKSGTTSTDMCFSEDFGMIHLCNRIHADMNTKFMNIPTEDQIEEMFADPTYGEELGAEFMDVAANNAQDYVKSLLINLREKNIDLVLSRGVFVGGGSARLRKYIEHSDLVRNPMFITDVRANAIGYETITKVKYAKRKG